MTRVDGRRGVVDRLWIGILAVLALVVAGCGGSDSAQPEGTERPVVVVTTNILGDVVNIVLDIISLSSAGAANTAPIQQARQPLTLAGAYMKNAAPNIIAATMSHTVGSMLDIPPRLSTSSSAGLPEAEA